MFLHPFRRGRPLLNDFKFNWQRFRSGAGRTTRRLALLGSVPATYMVANGTDELSTRFEAGRESMTALARSYLVYSLCSIPALVDHAPGLLDALSRVPVVSGIMYGLVRVTFFDQFVGGETASAALPLLRSLRAANKGTLFAYSVEVDEAEARRSQSSTTIGQSISTQKPHHKRVVDEIISCIDVSADFEDSLRGSRAALSPHLHDPSYLQHTTSSSLGSSQIGRRTWVAIKVTALLPDAHSLLNLSRYITEERERMRESSRNSPHGMETRCDSEKVKVQDVPFPGAPLSSDMDPILSSDPSSTISAANKANLKDLYDDLVKICLRAEQRGVRLVLDAEYSWYQPALDAITLALMRRFNAIPDAGDNQVRSVQPLIYGTYQAYLRRVPEQLAYTLEDAKKHKYALGVKLVRGAYHPYEIKAHSTARESRPGGQTASPSISFEELPPVWLHKSETDIAYDGCLKTLISAVKEDVTREREGHTGARGVAVLFGTHNAESCELVLKELVRSGLGEEVRSEDHNSLSLSLEEAPKPLRVKVDNDVVERVTMGQLYGMCDELTDSLASRVVSETPMIIKYIPYGGLQEVIPYLSRRAIENKSVLGEGAAVKERKRALRGIMARLRGM